MPHPSSHLAALFVLLACCVAPAAAKDAKEQPLRPMQIQELYNCRDIADPTERLACFDREVGELQTADIQRDITITDRATVQKTRRGLFGFTLPDFGLFGGGDEDEIKSIESTVASASQVDGGRYRIALADDSVWVQTDDRRLALAPRAGQKIQIKTASLGTYFLSLEGRPSIRVRRER
ncbi:MAG: hypothetical protein WA978_06370 [Sphingopyxis granuli]|uniref:hypothetical protein n=2 Tax=Sphingopyxis granuli TaxID=267128 RepID=UPI003C78E8B8